MIEPRQSTLWITPPNPQVDSNTSESSLVRLIAVFEIYNTATNLDSGVFSKVIVLTNQFLEMVEYYAGLIRTDIPIQCIETPAPRLPKALKEMKLETTFVLHYSDIIIEGGFKWKNLLNRHMFNKEQFQATGTLMASSNYKLPVGRIMTGDMLMLDDFVEKPESFEVGYTINMAVSIFEPDFLNYVDDTDRSLYGDSLKRAKDNEKKFCLFGHKKWRHIQTWSDWYQAQNDRFPSEEGYLLNKETSQE